MSKKRWGLPAVFFFAPVETEHILIPTHRFSHRICRDVPWCVSTRNFKDLFDIAEIYVILQNLFMEKT